MRKQRRREVCVHPLFEILEPRLLLSADVTATWIGASGDWWDANNWDTPVAPNNGGGITYHAVLNVADDQLITVNQPVTLNDLTNAETLRFTASGTSTLHDAVVNTGKIEAAAGMLNFSSAAATNVNGTITADGGTVVFDGSTINEGKLRVTDNSSSIIEFKYDITQTNVAWEDLGAGWFRATGRPTRFLGDYAHHLPAGYELYVYGSQNYLRLLAGEFRNDGVIWMSQRLDLEGDVTLSGTGEVRVWPYHQWNYQRGGRGVDSGRGPTDPRGGLNQCTGGE